MSDLGILFVGCGKAARMHSRTLRKLGERGPRYYASRDPQRAQRFSDELGGAGSFASYAQALGSAQIDLVIVTTPPVRHREDVLAALDAGKHVVVEKPAFLSLAHFDEVAAAAARADRRVFVAENYYYKPVLRRLRQLVGEGAIGDPVCLYVNALKQQTTGDWRDDPDIAGGGALLEGGIHWVNFMANLGLEVRAVSAHLPGNPAPGRDRSSVLVFDYAEGAVGTLLYSWDTPSPLKGLRVSRLYGREGSIFFESNGLVMAVYGRKKRVYFPGLRDIAGYRGMFRDFLRALREDCEPELTFEIARRDYLHLEQAGQLPGPRQISSWQSGETACSG